MTSFMDFMCTSLCDSDNLYHTVDEAKIETKCMSATLNRRLIQAGKKPAIEENCKNCQCNRRTLAHTA